MHGLEEAMSNIYGRSIKVSIFGESHGAGIGVVIDGMEPGLSLDMEEVRRQMARRAPGGSLSTPRKEADQVEILSGIRNDVTCGTPICGVIYNQNTRSKDYDKTRSLLRPSHADYTGHVKYRGYEDYRGGGHFSGRITAPLVFAGAICRQALEARGIQIGSHIVKLYDIEERRFAQEDLTAEKMEVLGQERLPLLNPENAERIAQQIENARKECNSLGGIVETALTGLPAGMGDPFFDSMESRLAQILFSVPAVKGVSFGAGWEFAGMTGAQANDPYRLRDGRIETVTNHNGGILGGITNGMPVVFQTVIKPTPSIARPQQTVNMDTMQEETLEITGRHDPCIIPRAIPVLEAAAMIAVYDAWKEAGNQ